MPDIYTAHHDGLVQVHRALAASFQAVIAAEHAPLAELVPLARRAGGFLLGHHEAEDKVLFPGYRKYGRLRSTDVAFLDTRDAEHHALHALCERFNAAVEAPRIIGYARELASMLAAHVAIEEEGLSPERTREMIDVAGYEALSRELEEHRARRGPPPT